MNEVKIEVYNMIGGAYCVESDDGQKVFDLLSKAFNEKSKVVLSFKNIEMITTAFLNTAIGQLYRDFPEEQIKDSLSVEELTPEDKNHLKRVISTAKLYYKDPDRLKRSIQEILGEEE